MKKIALLGIILALIMLLAPAETTTVYVTRSIPAGGTMWNVVEDAMGEYGDSRTVDAVMYDVRKLNPSVDPGRIFPGQRIIIPLQVKK